MTTHRIRFTIGDWSQDGHNQFRDYVIESNKPVEELREAHFKAKDKIGFDIGDICSESEQNQLTLEQYKALRKIKVLKGDGFDPEKTGNKVLTEDDVIDIWLKCLIYIDPSLAIKVDTKDDKIPTMHHYGNDKKKRHLSVPGYGVFNV